MDSFMGSFKRFISNRNTVTILGVLLALIILYIGYNWRIKVAIQPITVPVAKTILDPRTPITNDNIEYISVAPAMIRGKALRSILTNGTKCVKYTATIPAGSMLFGDTIIDCNQMPDSVFSEVPKGEVLFSFPVTLATTFGNSIMPESKINMYFKAVGDDGKVIIGKLLTNIKVLDVRDSAGKHVFETNTEDRVPAYLIFSLPENKNGENLHLLLRKAMYLKDFSAELIPVPNTEKLEAEGDEILITSQFLKEFILNKTGFVPVEELPNVTPNDTTIDDTDNNGLTVGE